LGLVENTLRLNSVRINAFSCKLYGLNKDELEFILEYFSVEDEKLKEYTLNEFDLIE